MSLVPFFWEQDKKPFCRYDNIFYLSLGKAMHTLLKEKKDKKKAKQ